MTKEQRLKAIDVINESATVIGNFRMDDGFCAVGALAYAAGFNNFEALGHNKQGHIEMQMLIYNEFGLNSDNMRHLVEINDNTPELHERRDNLAAYLNHLPTTLQAQSYPRPFKHLTNPFKAPYLYIDPSYLITPTLKPKVEEPEPTYFELEAAKEGNKELVPA